MSTLRWLCRYLVDQVRVLPYRRAIARDELCWSYDRPVGGAR